jgi:hypothetical protein
MLRPSEVPVVAVLTRFLLMDDLLIVAVPPIVLSPSPRSGRRVAVNGANDDLQPINWHKRLQSFRHSLTMSLGICFYALRRRQA